jgi:hypothetical protein
MRKLAGRERDFGWSVWVVVDMAGTRKLNNIPIFIARLGGGGIEGYNTRIERTGVGMTVQTLKLGGERFVLIKEKDYRDLKAKVRSVRAKHRLSTRDRGDIAEAKRRSQEPARPYAELRKELGLA